MSQFLEPASPAPQVSSRQAGHPAWLQVYKAKLRGMQDVAVKVACAHDLADGSWVTRLRKEVAMLQKVGQQPPPSICAVRPVLRSLLEMQLCR